MSEVQVYLFAPRRTVMGGLVRKVRIERADFTPAGGTYSPGEVLVDADVPCPDETPDQCLLIRGKVEETL